MTFSGSLRRIIKEELVEHLLNVYPDVLGRREELKLDVKLSKWYVLGAYVGDFSRGKVNRRRIQLVFGSTNYNGLTWAYKVFSNLGNVHICVKPQRGFRKDLLVYLSVTAPKNEFNELLMTKNEIVSYVVKYVKKTGDLNALFDFISGLSDAEADVGYFYDKVRNQYRIYLRISQAKIEILNKIRNILNEYGYVTTLKGKSSRTLYELVTYDTNLLMNLNLLHPEKEERIKFVKIFRKTTFNKYEFEKCVIPHWPKHIRGDSSKWLLTYYPEALTHPHINKGFKSRIS